MDDKKQKSIDSINKRIQKLGIDIDVPLDLDYMTILLKGQSPQYHVRFAAWARNTLDKDEHMLNLVRALLSKFATDSLLGNNEHTDDFVRGQANGVLFLYEEMQRLSNVSSFIIGDKENS
jgi:hypothetical protein